jgi:hypothetical protein
MRDHRDLCIEMLAAELAVVAERADAATSERDVWREMNQESLRQWHQLRQENARLRERLALRSTPRVEQRDAA